MVKLGKYTFVNEEAILEVQDELQNFKEELAWVLYDYINLPYYFSNVSDSVVQGFYDRRHDISIVENPVEYIEYDLQEWVKENPKYKDIYIKNNKEYKL